jgi:DNA-binding CsgD family transcriptional regulator
VDPPDALVPQSSLLAAAEAMRGGGLVVAGGAGTGKTELARSVLRPFHPVRWVRGHRSVRGIPFGAFLPVLGKVPDSADDALVTAHRMFATSPAVLAVDDAHLLDDLSAALVMQLAVREVRPILVTVRTGPQAPDPITALWKDGLLDRLEIAPPAFDECVRFVERLLEGRIQSASARLLHEATAGNLAYLRHLVAGERARRRLRCDHGIWHWNGRRRLTPALTALVAAEIGEPPSDVLRVLELLALAGRLDVDSLRTLSADSTIDEAADRQLISVSQDGARWMARLAHPLFADVVAARLSPVRTHRLCGLLIDTLQSTSAERGPGAVPRREGAQPNGAGALQLGRLALRGGQPSDPGLLLASARQAAAGGDWDGAIRLATEAGAAGAGFDADLLVALAHSWSMRGADAESRYRDMVTVAAGDRCQLTRLAQARAMNLSLNLARPGDARALLAEAAAQSTQARLELLGAHALLDGLGGRLADAGSAARHVLTRADVSPVARSHAACALALTTALTGDTRELPDETGDHSQALPDVPTAGLPRLWWTAYGLGVAARTDLLRRLIDRWSRSSEGVVAALFRSDLEGWLALVTGQLTTAVRLLAEFRPMLDGHGGGWTTPLELRLAMALGMAGDPGAARAAIERARSAQHPAVTVFAAQFELAEAWASAAEGVTSTAIRHARKAALHAGQWGQLAIEVLARHAAVTFGDKGHSGRLSELAYRVGSPRARGAAAHAVAFDAGDDAGMLAAAAQLARTGSMLLAAEAAAQAEAVARERRNPQATAAAAAAAAHYLTECDGARTPALEAATRPLAISKRQREAVAMAASGLTNREISERLGVSIRTVEGHIYQACVKLGVPNRAALAALLDRSAYDRHVT